MEVYMVDMATKSMLDTEHDQELRKTFDI